MFTDDAVAVLKRADPDFHFGRHDLTPERSRCIELPVWLGGRHVGYLEHNEMPDRQPVEECFGRYGMPWCEARKMEGYRPYRRDSWEACFRNIIGQVPRRVKESILRQLRKRGLRL